MDIHQLKVFSAVYRNRSFTKAAEEMRISQPTISEHVKNLERDLGCRLFDRLGRAIIPTSEAELIFPRACQLIEDLERMREEVAASAESLQGSITIGASTIPGTYLLPRLALQFKRQNPDVVFNILIGDTAEITEKVLQHELRLGVVGARLSPQKLDYLPFIDDELVLVGSPGLFDKDEIDFAELRHVPFLLREEGSGTRRVMEEYLQQKKLSVRELNVVASLGSTGSVREALKEGPAASILSRAAVREELATGVLREYRLDGLTMERSFFLITHKRRSLPNQYQAFFEFLSRQAR